MFRFTRPFESILFAGLIALFVCQGSSFAATTPPPTPSGHLSVSSATPVDPDDPLQMWFTEQDQLMETLLMRLARIEILVREIHQLITSLPDGAPKPLSLPGQASPAASDDTETGVLYVVLGLLFLLSVMLALRLRRATRPAVSADSSHLKQHDGQLGEQPAAPGAPAEPVSLTLEASQSMPPTPHGNADQALELAEIMLSMGLGQGAAQTLIEQIRREPKQALQHWLKLLEIYRESNQKTEFERFANELRQHFNILPTGWEAASSDRDQSIENYAHIAAKLCDLWRQPGCLQYLETLLKDNRGGTRNGFPQSVAEELIFLSTLLKHA